MTGKRRAERPTRSLSRPAAPPQPGAQVIAPTKSRRELRAERRRQRRRRFGAAGIAAIVVVVVVVLGVGGFFVHRATSGTSTPTDPQTTLLVSLQGSDGTAIASMLGAHDVKHKQGLELLVPSRLITDVCGFGSQQFGQIIALPRGTPLAQQALSQVLGGVTVDGSWLLSTQQLARLVDTVGGVTVDVDVDVERSLPGGTTQVVVPAGKGQHLNGANAVAFATYQASGEDAAAVLSRFQTVFQAVANRLPAKAAATQRVLTAAGVHATLPMAQLASLLVAVSPTSRTPS